MRLSNFSPNVSKKIMEKSLRNRVWLLLIVLFIFIIGIVSFFFRTMAIKESKDRALMVSESVRDTLTSYMVMGVMDRRDEFLNRIKEIPGVENIKVIRGEVVIRQFGPGKPWERAEDDLEIRVMKEGIVLDR